MSGGKGGTVAEGLVVLAALALIGVGSFGLAVGLVRLAGSWGPILAGLGLMVLGLAILLAVLAVIRSRRPRTHRGRQVEVEVERENGGWDPVDPDSIRH